LSSEPPGIAWHKMKHSYPGGNRVLSLAVFRLIDSDQNCGDVWIFKSK
jgi:hypothetical protein